MWFYHKNATSVDTFLDNQKLNAFFDITSVNFDGNGKWFVSSIEAKDYPIYAVQFHPERNAY